MNEPIEERLRILARERIASGQLPSVTPSQMWAGPGGKQPCALCDTPIRPDLVEYEVEAIVDGVTSTLFFHRICQSIWQLEVARADYSKRPP
jgi:hypothetical protein